MAYCEGGDLCTYIQKYKGKLFAEQQVVEWFVQITLALQVKYKNLFSYLKHFYISIYMNETYYTVILRYMIYIYCTSIIFAK